MLFQTQSNVLFRLFRLLTAQVGSNLVIICTNSLDCYKKEMAALAKKRDKLLEYNVQGQFQIAIFVYERFDFV